MLRAGTGRRFTHLSGGNGAVSGASVDLNFGKNVYWGNGSIGPINLFLTIARASIGTNLLYTSPSGFVYTTYATNAFRLDSNGLLIEEARHNTFVNSTTPVTQTITTFTTGAHTLWVNGSGSATSAAGTAVGTGFGTATNGTPNIFTITSTGTITVTVSGSLNTAQVELGGFPTSFIPTTAAQVTRNADNIFLGANYVPANSQTYFVAGSLNSSVASGTLIQGGSNRPGIRTATTSIIGTIPGVADLGTINGVASPFKSAWAFAQGDQRGAANGTLSTTSAQTYGTTPANLWLGASSGGGNYINSYLNHISIFTYRVSDAGIKSLTS